MLVICFLFCFSIYTLTKKGSLANIAARFFSANFYIFCMVNVCGNLAANLICMVKVCGKPQLHYLNGCRKFQKTCCGDVLANFWQCSGEFLEMFWQTFGNVLANFWQCSGNVLANFWQCSGKLLAMFWQTFGDVLANFLSQSYE